ERHGANGLPGGSRRRPPRCGDRIPAGPAGRRSNPGAREVEGAVLRLHLPRPRVGPLWSRPRKCPDHAILPGLGGLECRPDNAGGPGRGAALVGAAVALRALGLGCGIRGGHGVVRDPEKGRTRPTPAPRLTGGACWLFLLDDCQECTQFSWATCNWVDEF